MWLTLRYAHFSVLIALVIWCNQIDAGNSRSHHRLRRPHNHQFNDRNRKCGYDGCPKPKENMINVHIVAHTHDDVGWLKTVDQYYYGSKSFVQKANVQLILDSVVTELLKDPEKRFIYAESAFFFKWWDQQTDTLKDSVKQLVNEGRLEFIGGAWSMNDEATTHYHSTIDQFTWGLRRLNDTFGECGRPRVGWQIDPFGHSREFASLLAQMGYDGLFLGRIDFQDKNKRLTDREMEMIFKASDSLGSKADLFTGVLYNTYSPPSGFCFDILCNDEPVIDDEKSPEFNADKKMQNFERYINEQAKYFRTNNVIVTMGGDFTFMNADIYYKSLDRLIRYANKRQLSGSNINLFYSTPSCYLKALHDSNVSWPTKSDDFFPYASDWHSYWTGYFTSRPTLKRFERVGNHFLQVCKQLSALSPQPNKQAEEHLTNLREVMGVMQHHDAVTGTEKQHVANDYARLLQMAIDKCSAVIKTTLNQLTIDWSGTKIKRNDDYDPKYEFEFETCADLNISSCTISEQSDKFTVTVYSPLARSTIDYVRIPVKNGSYEVLDYRNVPVPSQIVAIPENVRNLQYRKAESDAELVFAANELPPLGYKSYFIQRKANHQNPNNEQAIEPSVLLMQDDATIEADNHRAGATITIGNKYLNLTFDENGLLSHATTEDAQLQVKQNFYVYKAYIGANYPSDKRSSGAYIFRPNVTEASSVVNRAEVEVFRGEIVDEIHQTFNSWISQVVRIYKTENYAEFQWMVGEIPIGDGNGREIVTRFDTNIESNGVFYTDANGREILKRRRDHRDTWPVNMLEKIAGNYYPVTTKIAIEDANHRMAILTDRSQGGSSLYDGSIELMVHRRLLHDDAFGVDEALNETAFGKGLIARGSHYFMVGAKKSTKQPSMQGDERLLQVRKLLPSWLFFSNTSKLTYDTWRTEYKNIFSGLSLSLPENVHLLTLEPWKPNQLLVRFEHIIAQDEDEQLAKPVTFNFIDVFRPFEVVSIRETTLAANHWVEHKRLEFTEKAKDTNEIASNVEHNVRTASNADNQTNGEASSIQPIVSARQYYEDRKYGGHQRKRMSELDDDNTSITLKPMEIRTFIVDIEPKLSN